MPPSRIRAVEDLRGPAGRLEAILNTGIDDPPYTALITHPHPPSGGTMHTRVVYQTMKLFSSFGLPVLRFNFRGAGLSEGIHDYGRGEEDDTRAAIDWLTRNFRKPILLAGFSFGAHVGLRAGCGNPQVAALIGLGLPGHAAGRDYTYEFLSTCSQPKLFVLGDHDQFAPRTVISQVFAIAQEPKSIVWVEQADHFFQGTLASPQPKLAQMSNAIGDWLQHRFSLQSA